MSIVLNKHKHYIPTDAVYIGRGSKWGNPFRIGLHGNRTTVIEKYASYLAKNEMLISSLDEIKGKDLVCFCAPAACHGDLLLKLSNATDEERQDWLNVNGEKI